MNPFFSIIIAVYNRENYIARAIESLIKQEYKNWEAIIVDDFSTDRTEKFIKPFLDDNRLSYWRMDENSGVAKTRNHGISKAQGKYITFLDSDDEFMVNHLHSRFKILNEREIDLLHGGVKIVGNTKVPDKNNTSLLIDVQDCVIGGTFFINSSSSKELKYFDENVKYSEDSKMFEEFEKKELIIVKTDLPTYVYHRDVDDSICNTVNK